MTTYNVQKYVSVRIRLDGKYINDRLLVRRTLNYNTETGKYTMHFGGKRFEITANVHDQDLKVYIDFDTVAGASVNTLLVELAGRIDLLRDELRKATPQTKAGIADKLTADVAAMAAGK